MLSVIRIRNLALVEDLEWTLSQGFTAVTGETGAGKSIILGALKLMLGERADRTLIRTGADRCWVEAVFQLDAPEIVNVLLDEQGVEPCEGGELVLKRSLSSSGSNRQFINGSPTTLGVLKRLGDTLIDLHGPHDHQSLFLAEVQMKMLDAYANVASLVEDYAGAYRRLLDAQAEFDALSTSEAALAQEVDLLQYQVKEISGAEIQPGEEGALDEDYNRASNSRKLLEISGRTVQLLSGADDAVLGRLSETQRLLQDLVGMDPALEAQMKAHESAVVDLEEIASTLQEYTERLDLDPARLAELEDRVNLLQSLKRKYGSTLEDVVEFGDTAATRLARIEGRADELIRLENEIKDARAKAVAIGGKLSAKRKAAAPKLAAQVRKHLVALGFAKAGFSVALEACKQPSPSGLEVVSYEFAPNPGEPSKPLKSIASSGEISRVMLALKTALADRDAIPLLVFDEIDANVGGEVANAVGEKMRTLGDSHQVLVITHLPQVASRAAAHFVVSKEVVDGRTRSLLTAVDGNTRIAEISRMLGGKTKSAEAHAREMLGV